MRRVTLLLLISIGFSAYSLVAQTADGCDLEFEGSYRKDVKLRSVADGAAYEAHGTAAQPLDLDQWFELTCSLEERLPDKVGTKVTTIDGVETVKVTVRAYLVAVKWDPDNDFHLQLGPEDKFAIGQVIAEIPPGNNHCDDRQKIVALIDEDRDQFGGKTARQGHIMRHRSIVQITGFAFIDGTHGTMDNACKKPHAAGVRGKFSTSPVRGLFEIHPVTSLEVVQE